jgi:Electron transfer DM13
MKRFLIGIAAGIVGGTLFGFALGIFVYPFWFLRDTAMERLSDAAARTEVAQGLFGHVNKADPVHWGKGAVSVFQDQAGDAVVFLHDTFEVGPGPRFHVYLVDRADVRSGDDFLASRRVDLGRLHAFKGSQVYPVPRGPAPADYKSVVIWCKEFGVLISPATLRTALSSTGEAPVKRSRLSTAGHLPATFAPKL